MDAGPYIEKVLQSRMREFDPDFVITDRPHEQLALATRLVQLAIDVSETREHVHWCLEHIRTRMSLMLTGQTHHTAISPLANGDWFVEHSNPEIQDVVFPDDSDVREICDYVLEHIDR